jgi:hypothetical protein
MGIIFPLRFVDFAFVPEEKIDAPGMVDEGAHDFSEAGLQSQADNLTHTLQ